MCTHIFLKNKKKALGACLYLAPVANYGRLVKNKDFSKNQLVNQRPCPLTQVSLI